MLRSVSVLFFLCSALILPVESSLAEPDTLTGSDGIVENIRVACALPSRHLAHGDLAPISRRVTDLLNQAESAVKERLSSSTEDEVEGVIARVRRSFKWSDEMHQRCWFDDQLSCSLMATSVEEVGKSLMSLRSIDLLPSTDQEAFESNRRKFTETIRDTRLDLLASCKKLPWKLG